MRTRMSVKSVLSLLLAAALACPVASLAAPGDGGGGGTAPDYGDLFVLDRDANGVPILTPEATAIDPETGLAVPAGLCQQPIAAAGVIFDPCALNSTGEFCLIPVDPITCAVLVDYASYTQEVDFARMNVARAPAAVMDRQLVDAIVNLATADCISLDPAGRLVYSMQDINDSDGDLDTEEYLSSAIDSPLQNLAIYKEMILKGQFGEPALVLPQPWLTYGFLDTAAKGLGAASDKGGAINVDLVVYLNQILGLTEVPTALGDPICIDVRQEVQGVVQLVSKCFLDYSGYNYLRQRTYRRLPHPAYIPEEAPRAGVFEYLDVYRKTLPNGDPLFRIFQRQILPVVFPDTATEDTTDFLSGFTGGNIGGIAQAADDARAIIEFMHSHPVLSGYETPLPCGVAHQTAYDVSIDATSGLQVPVRMVAGTEGREGTVVVANAGPDAASGSVTVEGHNSTGTPIIGPMTFEFADLPAGASQSWTFPVFTTQVGTIYWTATVTATYDVYSANNSVTGLTEVTAQ